jgi:hypothetical protein
MSSASEKQGGGAADAAPHVDHPVSGTITDPRRAYLLGYAEGIQEDFRLASDQVLAELAKRP